MPIFRVKRPYGAYRNDVKELSRFLDIKEPEKMRIVPRAYLFAWRTYLEQRNLAAGAIRRKLASISSLFQYLCEHNAVLHNPVLRVKRPAANNNEGTTPTLGERAILATLLFHGLRREKLCRLQVKDLQQRSGVQQLSWNTEKQWASSPSWTVSAYTRYAQQQQQMRWNMLCKMTNIGPLQIAVRFFRKSSSEKEWFSPLAFDR